MEKEFKSFFKKVGGNEGDKCHYSTRLDTYGCGCQNNCGYCYARSLLDFRNLWNPADPAVADIRKIRNTIATKLHRGDVVRLGGMTDCFQNAEREHGVTYETIRALNDADVHYLIVTKNADLLASAKYTEILDRDLAHIQVSITNTDAVLGRKVEPGATPFNERIAAVERLQDLGFDVAVRLSPFIPEFVDLDVINGIRCNKIVIEFLRVNAWIRKWLVNLGVPIDLSRYVLKSAGYLHMTLDAKKELVRKIKGFREVTVCEDVTAHWLYWKDNVNANPNDCCNLQIK